MTLNAFATALTAALAIALAPVRVSGDADTGPTAFAAIAEVQGARLQLNGAGTRQRAAVPLYELALYTTRKVETSEELLALAAPTRLQFVALREMSSTDLGQLFVKGMQENATREQHARQMTLASRLVPIFSQRSRVLPGESFAIDYAPDIGTQFSVQGRPLGAPIADADFFPMVLRIWFGPAPVDRALRDALLGRRLPI